MCGRCCAQKPLVNDTCVSGYHVGCSEAWGSPQGELSLVTGQHQPPLLAVAPLSSSDPGAQRFLENGGPRVRKPVPSACRCLGRSWPRETKLGPQPQSLYILFPTD